jgi:PAS domain S-box-containing protein
MKQPALRILILAFDSDGVTALKNLIASSGKGRGMPAWAVEHIIINESRPELPAIQNSDCILLVDHHTPADIPKSFSGSRMSAVLSSARRQNPVAPILLFDCLSSPHLRAEAMLLGASHCMSLNELDPASLIAAIDFSYERRFMEAELRSRLSFDKLITKLSMQFINCTPDQIRREVDRALQLLGGHIGASRSFIFLRHENGAVTEEFEWCAPGIPSAANPQLLLQFDELGWIAERLSSAGVLIVADKSSLPPEARRLGLLMEERGVASLALFALRSRSDMLGALGFSVIVPRKTWHAETVRLLTIAAEILANALQQHQVQRELRRSELRYRTVVQGLGEGILLCDTEDRILQVNDRLAEITGYSVDELVGSTASSLLLPQGEEHLLRERTAQRLKGVSERYEIRLQRKDGTRFWAQINATPVYDDHGNISATLGAVTDVSGQIAAVEALRASEEKYRDLVETSSDLIWSVDLEGRITFINSACRAVYRREPEELIGMRFLDLVDPSCREKDLELFQAILEGKEIFQAETRHMRPDGSSIALSVNAIPLRGPERDIIGATGTASDITLRRTVEYELKSQREFLRQVVDLAPILILVKDHQCRFTLVNQAFAAQYGLTPEEIIGKLDTEIHPNKAEAQEFFEETKRVIETLEPLEVLERALTDPRTGEPRWHYTIRKPLILPDGRPPQVLTVATDITPRRKAEDEALRLEKQLLQAQKMEAIGQLAAGVAHDLNNALGAVVGHLQLLQLSPDLSPSVANSLEIALSGCERALSLIEQLLGFSRQGKYNLEHHSLRSLVDDTVAFLSKIIEKDIVIRFEGTAEDYSVHVDAGQIQQALTNLIINAKQAMPAGGTITFRFGTSDVPEPRTFNPKAKHTRFAVLSVCDTGPGISPSIADKVFEPFFTTKQSERGGGTGLGLAMVYGILQSHGGWVDIDPTYKGGACFRLFLPLQGDKITMVGDREPVNARALESSSGNILVIDDEPILVDLTRRFLEIAGISSVGFTSGEEAVRWYETNHSSIDLVVLDMKMAKMDGPTCFAALRAINPKVRVAILSGYVQDESAQQLLASGALRFFQKPLKYPELVRWITSELTKSN